MLDDDGFLPLDAAKKFIGWIENYPITAVVIQSSMLTADDEALKEWLDYFVAKRKRLLEFLRRSLNLQEPIYCSL